MQELLPEGLEGGPGPGLKLEILVQHNSNQAADLTHDNLSHLQLAKVLQVPLDELPQQRDQPLVEGPPGPAQLPFSKLALQIGELLQNLLLL